MKVVRVISTVDGFRRAGLSHPAQAVDHPAKDITPGQLVALKAEPKLIVQELDVPDKEAPKAGGK